jgi:hypothetical protein
MGDTRDDKQAASYWAFSDHPPRFGDGSDVYDIVFDVFHVA